MHASVFRKVVSVAVAILSASVSFSPVTLLSQNSESPPEVVAGELQDGTEVPDSPKPPPEPEDIPPDATSSGVSMPQDMDGSIAPGA